MDTSSDKHKNIIIVSLNTEDFLNYKEENNLKGDGLETIKKFKIGNKQYYRISKVRHLCSLGVDGIIETDNAKKNIEYENIMESVKQNLNYNVSRKKRNQE